MMEALQKLPGVQVIVSDDEKTICSVSITVARTERVDSGSMMFHHPRYITFGQTVIFTKNEIHPDQSGALVFAACSEEDAITFIKNIHVYIPHGKEKPEDSVIIEEVH